MPVDVRVLPFGPTQRLQALLKGRRPCLSFRIILRIVHQHCDPAHPVGLLRARRDRPGGCRAAKKGDERPPPHSRTSLARATNTSDKNPSQNRLKRITRQASWTKPRKLRAWYSQRM